MIKIRKENLTLVYGNYKNLLPDDDIFCYRRWNDEHEFITSLNFSEGEVKVSAEHVQQGELIINNYDKDNREVMYSWQAKLYKI